MGKETVAYGIKQAGGVDKLVPIETGTKLTPEPHQVILEQKAVGLNFIDIYHRTGLYPLPLPSVLGLEGAGTVIEVGSQVRSLTVGDRVAYGTALGAYANMRLIDADKVIKLPDWLDEEMAAASMLRGMTAEYLIHRTYAVQKGDYVLFHAAAGGLGQIALQWLAMKGAQVIGVVSSDKKAKIAKSCGADHVIIGRDADLASQVDEITKGQKCKVVYDSVGKASFIRSLDCLAPLGMMVSFGNASGPIDPIDAKDLATRGGLFFTRPSLMNYTATRPMLELSAKRWFQAIKDGVKVHIGQRHALSHLAQAHEKLQQGGTIGACILLP